MAAWLDAHHDELGIDFGTLSDHSDFFPATYATPSAAPDPTAPVDPWTRQAVLASRYHGGDSGFSVLRGFEWTNDQENHLNVIGSQNWTSRFASGDASLHMQPFWQWLTTDPAGDPTGHGLGPGGGDGIGQFNHPGDKGALNWDDYALDPAAAQKMATIEIHGDQAATAHGLAASDAGWYWFALSQGWTVSPVMNWDWHTWNGSGVVDDTRPGGHCGDDHSLPCQRSLVIASQNTPVALLDALRHRRTSASELPDLWATLRSDGQWQGSTADAAPGSSVTLTVDAGSATGDLRSVDIVSDNGVSPYPYYYGDNAPCDVTEAPSVGDPTQNCDPENLSHSQLTISYAEQHRRYAMSGGHATVKRHIDAPPTGTVVATVALDGHRATRTIKVTVPEAPSTRPDGKHFFYAVVHADAPAGADHVMPPPGAARAWTGPILTAGPPAGQWIAGDTHVHDDHSSDGSFIRQGVSQEGPGNLSVGDQVGQAERTGLGFLPLTDHRTYSQQWDPQWTSNQLVLVPGEEANGSPHATVLGAADELVDGANPPTSAPFRHIQQSVWDVHAQDASWGTAHPDDGEFDPSTDRPNANASTIGVDTIEVWNKASDVDAEIRYAEDRWNKGWRTGVAGASDDHFKEVWAIAGPGQPTTWVYAATRTSRGVVDGLRAGHTTVSSTSTGPLVTMDLLDADGHWLGMTGDEVAVLAGTKGSLRVRVQRGSGDTVIVYGAPGRSAGPLATFTASSADQTFLLPVTFGAGWYRAEVRGVGAPPGLTDIENYVEGAKAVTDPGTATSQLLAIASPVFVAIGGARATPTAEIALPATAMATDPVATSLALGQAGRFTGFPNVAASVDDTHVVAEQHDGGVSHVVYRRLSSGDENSKTPAVELTPETPSARFPAVAARGRDVWVVWQDERTGETPHRPRLYLRHSSDRGRHWDAEQPLTAGEGRAEHPAIAVSAIGRPLVAWSDNRTGPFNVYVQEIGVDATPIDLSAPGKVVTTGTPADTRSAVYPASLFPSLAVAPNGTVAVAWADDRTDDDPLWTGHLGGTGTEPDDWEILVAHRQPAGSWSLPVNAGSSPSLADRHPSASFAGDGSLIVAWDAKALQSSGANLSLRWTRSSDGGATFAPASTLALDRNAMSEHPRLSTDEAGGVRAVWYDSRSTDWRWSVWTASFSPRSGWSAPARISGPGNATYPAISQRHVVFATDRNARLQRDTTEEIYVAQIA